MDKISKALKKFSPKEREKIKEILLKLKNNSLNRFDIKKLKGSDDIFRIRKGDIRIIYKIDKNDNLFILAVERRSDNTYKF
ncbi:type II toxin-antitoxin system RelE/ParE family toxin [Candidatus Parcubacteria bacterium]|nr:type II toxin-antitoxin system RelE/ParE family toxin [Candidatus Parcubacteria bacterium]